MLRARFPSIIGRTIAGLALCHGLANTAAAAGDPPPAPSSFVQDDARLFDAAAVERMSRALIEMHQSTGVSVYVATSSYQEAAVNRNHAQQLVKPWLNDKPGVILTYNRGNGRPGVVASPELWRRHPADETAQMLADVSRALSQPGTGPEHRIQEAVLLVVERIRQWDARRGMQNAVFTGVEFRLAAFLGATIALTGLVTWLFSCRCRRKVVSQGGPYLFPEVTANNRLGGQFGGGSIGESSAPRRD